MAGFGGVQPSAGDAWTEEQLDKWLSAKRQKDFATADAIRDVLRAMGVDPDTARPRGWSPDGGCSGGNVNMGNVNMGNVNMGITDNAMNGMQNNMMQMMQMMNQMPGAEDSNPAKKQRTDMSGFGGAQSSTGTTGDPYTDDQLEKWSIAKRTKDYATADAIRDQLRTIGVDPDLVRPYGCNNTIGKTGDAWMDAQLDKWLIAKKSKDFAQADAIRDELRTMGIDPDTVRPRGWERQTGGASSGDPWTEQQLDKWLIAKKQKDFATADQIRDELRGLGVDPDTMRPRKPTADSGCSGDSKGCGKGNQGNTDNALNAMENNMMQMMGMMTQMMGIMSQNMAQKFCR